MTASNHACSGGGAGYEFKDEQRIIVTRDIDSNDIVIKDNCIQDIKDEEIIVIQDIDNKHIVLKDNDIHDIKDEGNIVAQDIDSKDIVTKDNRIQDIKDKVTGGNIEGGESW